MEPIEFKGCNSTMGKDQPEYNPLPACRVNDNRGTIISCHKLTDNEIEIIKETKRIYLSLFTFGQPIQPQLLSVTNPVEEYYPDSLGG